MPRINTEPQPNIEVEPQLVSNENINESDDPIEEIRKTTKTPEQMQLSKDAELLMESIFTITNEMQNKKVSNENLPKETPTKSLPRKHVSDDDVVPLVTKTKNKHKKRGRPLKETTKDQPADSNKKDKHASKAHKSSSSKSVHKETPAREIIHINESDASINTIDEFVDSHLKLPLKVTDFNPRNNDLVPVLAKDSVSISTNDNMIDIASIEKLDVDNIMYEDKELTKLIIPSLHVKVCEQLRAFDNNRSENSRYQSLKRNLLRKLFSSKSTVVSNDAYLDLLTWIVLINHHFIMTNTNIECMYSVIGKGNIIDEQGRVCFVDGRRRTHITLQKLINQSFGTITIEINPMSTDKESFTVFINQKFNVSSTKNSDVTKCKISNLMYGFDIVYVRGDIFTSAEYYNIASLAIEIVRRSFAYTYLKNIYEKFVEYISPKEDSFEEFDVM